MDGGAPQGHEALLWNGTHQEGMEAWPSYLFR